LYLTDFLMAYNIKDNERIEEEPGVVKGTLAYIPPENLNSSSETPKIEKQDVWAIGIIAY
jgi:serine/threonine protein kinase